MTFLSQKLTFFTFYSDEYRSDPAQAELARHQRHLNQPPSLPQQPQQDSHLRKPNEVDVVVIDLFSNGLLNCLPHTPQRVGREIFYILYNLCTYYGKNIELKCVLLIS